jgi:hypothetical protein
VLPWRLDPDSEWRHPDACDLERHVRGRLLFQPRRRDPSGDRLRPGHGHDRRLPCLAELAAPRLRGCLGACAPSSRA